MSELDQWQQRLYLVRSKTVQILRPNSSRFEPATANNKKQQNFSNYTYIHIYINLFFNCAAFRVDISFYVCVCIYIYIYIWTFLRLKFFENSLHKQFNFVTIYYIY